MTQVEYSVKFSAWKNNKQENLVLRGLFFLPSAYYLYPCFGVMIMMLWVYFKCITLVHLSVLCDHGIFSCYMFEYKHCTKEVQLQMQNKKTQSTNRGQLYIYEDKVLLCWHPFCIFFFVPPIFTQSCYKYKCTMWCIRNWLAALQLFTMKVALKFVVVTV